MVALLSVFSILFMTNDGQTFPPDQTLTLEEQVEILDQALIAESVDFYEIIDTFSRINSHYKNANIVMPQEVESKMFGIVEQFAKSDYGNIKIKTGGVLACRGYHNYRLLFSMINTEHPKIQSIIAELILNNDLSLDVRHDAVEFADQQTLSRVIDSFELRIDFDNKDKVHEEYYPYLCAIVRYQEATPLQFYRFSEEFIHSGTWLDHQPVSTFDHKRVPNANFAYAMIRVNLYRPDAPDYLLYQASKAADADLVRSRPLLEKIVESRKHDSEERELAKSMLLRIETLK